MALITVSDTVTHSNTVKIIQCVMIILNGYLIAKYYVVLSCHSRCSKLLPPPFIKHHKVAMFIRNVLHSHGKNHLNLYKIEMVVYDRN